MAENQNQRIESMSSYEFGRSDSRVKLYFFDADELDNKLSTVEKVLIKYGEFIKRQISK